MIGIPLGLLYANMGEWIVHKHLLHGAGKKKGNFWNFHWHEHHNKARKNDMLDEAYTRPLRGWNSQTKEAAGLLLAAAVHAPLFPVAPFFTGAYWYSLANYYVKHRRAHLDPQWAREHLPWHYDHHMGAEQDANWCVTKPWFDLLVGTRQVMEDRRTRNERQPAPEAEAVADAA